MRIIISFILSLVFLSTGFAQFDFNDNFDQYIQLAPLACQNSTDWTTWDLTPCDPIEDPIISTAHFYSSPKSVVIFQYNNLIKPLGNDSTGRDYINFEIYIPTGKSGYFSLLSRFTSLPYQKAVECYFDADGTGRLMSVPGAPVTFDYSHNQWHYVQTVIDFNLDEAQFWLDGLLVYTWQWTQNGTITKNLSANNFYGPYTSNEYYIDNYELFHEDCLQCEPPLTPENLTLEEIFSTVIAVQLQWQQDFSIPVYEFNILRKNGPANIPGDFEIIGNALSYDSVYVDTSVIVDSTYSYGVMAFNIYGYSDTSNIESITVTPIPVELISFNSEVAGNKIILRWTTATEKNNKGFDIEKKDFNDVAPGSNIWKKIGFVAGNGTTALPHSYSFADKNVQSGDYLYRLKQTDYNRSFKYSKEVEVNLKVPFVLSLEQNYPNPFNPATTIIYQLPKAGFMTLKVYDDLGREVATLINEEKPAGTYKVEFSASGGDGSNLSSGVYFYQLRSGTFIQTKKMILLR